MTKKLLNININNYKEEKIETTLSGYDVFIRLYNQFKNVFILESLGEEGRFNRYSYVGFDPSYLISGKNNNLYINGTRYRSGQPFDYISKLLGKITCQNKNSQNDSSFRGGLVGFISHEGTKYFEPAFVGYKNSQFPDFSFGLFLDGFKFDKKTKKLSYFHNGKSRLKDILPYLKKVQSYFHLTIQTLSPKKGEKGHKSMVKTALEHIKAGNIFQVVLALKTPYFIKGDTRKIYTLLRKINPSLYMYFIKFGSQQIIGASPELLIRIKGRNIEHFGTLAGTTQRGKNKKEDAKLANKLLNDYKEKAEHMMLVDLARNDVGKISKFGTVKVDKLLTIKKYSHVQHLYSEVRGQLKDNENCLTALSACFPAGTLTGAPKIEAMKIIKELEGEARGPYGGVVGYMNLKGDAMFAIAIRSLFINGDKGYTATGSGIVYDSKPAREFQEIMNKQKAMEVALRKAAMYGA